MDLRHSVERADYVSRYSRDAWARAVYLAGSHRRRAVTQYGLLEHWTAPEWLDLCSLWDMKCPRCQETKQLTPHHRVDLCWGGSNLIENILPVCEVCHGRVGEMDCSEGWLERQRALCLTLQPGVEVVWTGVIGRRGPDLLTVAEVFPPMPMASAPNVRMYGARWGHRKSGLVVVGREITEWAGEWTTVSDGLEGVAYQAEELMVYTADVYAAWVQQRLNALASRTPRVPRRRRRAA